ncbi:MAG: hypothetical protein U0791_03950 [Gemmataceae bacterium]
MSGTLNRERLFPALRTGLLHPEWEPVCPAIGHGLVVQLYDGDSAVGPEQLHAANLAAEDAHRIAIENLARFADESPDLTIQVLGNPGDAVHLLLYSDHPHASACLLLPDLHEHAAEELRETDLLACVPQRESLVVFPKRDRAYRESIVRKLREIEADATHPLTFELFALSVNGVSPFSE